MEKAKRKTAIEEYGRERVDERVLSQLRELSEGNNHGD